MLHAICFRNIATPKIEKFQRFKTVRDFWRSPYTGHCDLKQRWRCPDDDDGKRSWFDIRRVLPRADRRPYQPLGRPHFH